MPHIKHCILLPNSLKTKPETAVRYLLNRIKPGWVGLLRGMAIIYSLASGRSWLKVRMARETLRGAEAGR